MLRGFLLATVLPPFEAWDEYQHLAYIDHCATSAQPVILGKATLDDSFVRAVAAQPWNHLPQAQTTPLQLYEAQQPPLYYRLMAPVYRLTGGRENLPRAVSILRLINLLLGGVTLTLMLYWLRTNLSPGPAFAAGCWVTFQPLILLNVVRVANDALACLLATALLVILLGKRSGWIQIILIAVLLPVAILAKSTNLVLIPLIPIVFLVRAFRHEIKLRDATISLLLIFIVCAAVTEPYLSSNLAHFDLLTPMQEAVINHDSHKSLAAVITAMPPATWLRTTIGLWVTSALWTGGWSFLRIPIIFTLAYSLLLLISAISLLIAILLPKFRRRLPIDFARLVLILIFLISAEAGLMYHAAESFSAWGKVTTNPWYTALAIPWWLTALCAALFTWPRHWMRRLILWSFPIVCLSAEIYGLFFEMIPYYSPRPSLNRFAFLAAAILTAILLIILIRLAINQHRERPPLTTEHAGT